jgi:error-prone DNA polymerase
VADYGNLGLTLRRHPLALLRPVLTRLSFQSAREVVGLTPGRSTHAAVFVITRQRPGTATGVVFLTLEDETGPLNVAASSSASVAPCSGRGSWG